MYISSDYEKFIKYDKQGKKHGTVSIDKLPCYLKYTGVDYKYYGIKKGNEIVISDKYDFIESEFGDIVHLSNGVFLVGLYEFGDKYSVTKNSDDVITHYGYVDLKGNDTFTEAVKKRCKESYQTYENVTTEAINEYNEYLENSSSYNSERIVSIYMKGEREEGRRDYYSLEGNYGCSNIRDSELWSNPLHVPQGKVWIFKNYKVTSSMLYSIGFIDKDEGDWCKTYGVANYLNQPSYKPVRKMNGERFYSGKTIYLVCDFGYAVDGIESFNVEVNFIERDD